MKHRLLILAALLMFAVSLRAETIRVTTYNVEHFNNNFMASRLTADKFQAKADTEEEKEYFKSVQEYVKRKNDEDNWEVAQTILDPKVNPDIIVLQECCNEKDLNYFNDRWLKKAYQTVIVFPNNSGEDRVQNVAMMLKPGFKVLEKRDQYHLEKDTVAKERGDLLFARGPAFVKIQSPAGNVFWVGTNHLKSKSGNDGPVTAWRNREAKRIHEIHKEIAALGNKDVIFLGDCNDENGISDEFEKGDQFGGDTIANLVGPAEDKYVLLTRPLLARADISFGGYWSDRFRSFIDHAVGTPEIAERVKGVSVFSDKLAPVASDHYPVTLVLEFGQFSPVVAPAPTTTTTTPAAVKGMEDAMP
jgi:endonuclease/exonuclease/phosphatase family metal-dependent hydrolase